MKTSKPIQGVGGGKEGGGGKVLAELRIPVTRNFVSSTETLTPLFESFVGFHLYQRGLIEVPLDQLISSLDAPSEVRTRSKTAKLQKFINAIRGSLTVLEVFLPEVREHIMSLKFSILFGPSASHPREARSLSIDMTDAESEEASSPSSSGSAVSPTVSSADANSYLSKLNKAMMRQMITNTEIFDNSKNIPVRSMFFSLNLRLSPSSRLANETGPLGALKLEETPLFQFYLPREGFQPKFRKSGGEKLLSIYRSASTGSTANRSNFSVISSQMEATMGEREVVEEEEEGGDQELILDFVLRKAIAVLL